MQTFSIHPEVLLREHRAIRRPSSYCSSIRIPTLPDFEEDWAKEDASQTPTPQIL